MTASWQYFISRRGLDGFCCALTRSGQRCRLSSLPGQDFCGHHAKRRSYGVVAETERVQ